MKKSKAAAQVTVPITPVAAQGTQNANLVSGDTVQNKDSKPSSDPQITLSSGNNGTMDLGVIPYGEASAKQTATITTSSDNKTYSVQVSQVNSLNRLNYIPCASTVTKTTPCVITFLYDPSKANNGSVGPLNASVKLTVTDMATKTDQIFTIPIKATLTYYSASVPATLYAIAGGDNLPQKVHVKNHKEVPDSTDSNKKKPGPAPEVDSIVFSGANALDFSASGCKKNNRHPDECDIDVSFHPAAQETGTVDMLLMIDNQQYKVEVTGQTLSCVNPPNWALPLRKAQDQTIYCFYNASSSFAFASQVRYLYNPAGSANVISGDLLSAQAPKWFLGTQFSLEGNATTSSCTQATSDSGSGSVVRPRDDTSTTSTDACNTTGNGSNTPSTEQVIETLEKGGDFAIKAIVPLLAYNPTAAQAMVFLSPRAGFTINGLSNQNTVTNGTEGNYYVPFEGYAQVGLLPVPGQNDSVASIFFDYRGGLESTSVDFAKQAGLLHHNFYLQYFSAGVAFNSSIRVSAQRYFGPSQSFLDSSGNPVNNFKSWQVGVQFTPTNVGK